MSRKPLIKKEGGKWIVWMPISSSHFSATAIKITYPTWGEALAAIHTWHRFKRTDTISPLLAQPSRRTVDTAKPKNIINHIVFVLDKSSSMASLTSEVVRVVDNQIAYLAEKSKQMDQETRVTVYTFADTPECIEHLYDKDVLRYSSIKDFYEPYGNTALIDATSLAIDDLTVTVSEKYGDHAILIYVLTDGEENASGRQGRSWAQYTSPELVSNLSRKIKGVPGNWTVACLVPHARAMYTAKQYGFPAGNVAVWDATSAAGVTEVGETVRRATDSYMAARATGTRSTTQLFDIGASVVNADAILDAGLTPVDYKKYELIPIPALPPKVSDEDWALAHPGKKRKKPLPWGGEIGDFVRKVNGGSYQIGKAYYQLTENRTVTVQPNKDIVILDTTNSRIYQGDGVRKLIGLSETLTVKIKPSKSDRFRVYVKSTSDNRHLYPGAPLLLFK